MRPDTDVSAYALRRDWAGRAIHICGMASADVDYLIGHKNTDTKDKDYTNYDVQSDIARQLNAIHFCQNTADTPITTPSVRSRAKQSI